MKKFLVLVILSCCTFTVFAQNNTLFEQATNAYNKGEFKKAIAFYEQIVNNKKHSANLYFNLGNCYYKLGEIGPSIFYYEKALLLNPGDPEIQNNLGYAQNMKLDAIEEMPESTFSRFYNSTIAKLSFDQWAYFAIGLMFLFVLAYVAYYLLQGASQKRFSFITSLAAIALCAISVCFAYLQYQKSISNNPAIIFSREVVVTSEPNDRSEKIFTLHEGTKVNILEKLGDWQKIKIADGQTGWLPETTLKLLKDF